MLNFVRRRKDVALEVFSTTNEWMDCVFFVSEDEADRAAEVLEEAFGKWFDEGGSEAHGDWLEDAMTEAGIEYEVFYTGGGEE